MEWELPLFRLSPLGTGAGPAPRRPVGLSAHHPLGRKVQETRQPSPHAFDEVEQPASLLVFCQKMKVCVCFFSGTRSRSCALDATHGSSPSVRRRELLSWLGTRIAILPLCLSLLYSSRESGTFDRGITAVTEVESEDHICHVMTDTWEHHAMLNGTEASLKVRKKFVACSHRESPIFHQYISESYSSFLLKLALRKERKELESN